MKEIENWKVIVADVFFDKSSTASVPIYCEFIPDEIVLKYVSVVDNSSQTNTNIYLFSSDLFNGQIFFSFACNIDPATNGLTLYNEQINTPFQMKNGQMINGNYTFSIQSSSKYAEITPAQIEIHMMLTLMFVKNKK